MKLIEEVYAFIDEQFLNVSQGEKCNLEALREYHERLTVQFSRGNFDVLFACRDAVERAIACRCDEDRESEMRYEARCLGEDSCFNY